MADSREEIIRMLAEMGNLPEDEIAESLDNLSEKTDENDVDKESAELLIKMIGEMKEKKKKDEEKICRMMTSFFADNEWMYSEVTQSKYPLYVLNFKTRRLNVSLRVIVETDQSCIRFDTVLPVTCKTQNHIILSYKIREINMPLRYGAFHLDTTDNEISYRYSLPYSSESFDGHLSGRIILAIVNTVDEYYETIVSYALGQISEDEKNNVLKAIQRNVEYFKKNS